MKYVTIDKRVVEKTAQIMGEHSASAEALKRAEGMKNPVFLKRKDRIVVFDAPVKR